NAALSGISAIPGLGDAVGAVAKGGKIIAKVAKGNKLLTGASKLLPNAGKLLDKGGKLIKGNKVLTGASKLLPNAGKLLEKGGKLIKNNKLVANASKLLPNAGKLTDLAKLTKKIPGKLAEVVKKIPLPNKVKKLLKGAVKYGVPAAVHGVNVAGFVGGISAAQEYVKKGDYVNAALSLASGSLGLGHTVKSAGKLGKGKINGVENKVKSGGGKSNRDLPLTGKQKEILEKTASKRGSELTPKELNAEREVARRAKRKPINDGQHIEEIELPNNHELKKQKDGTWCRFSEPPGDCGPQFDPDKSADAKTPDKTPEESVIREAVDAIGKKPNQDLREAAQSLRQEGIDEFNKLGLETPQQQRELRNAGIKADNPILIPTKEAALGANAIAQDDLASAKRKRWTSEHYAFGYYSPGDKVVRETQTGSPLPGSIFVAQGGKYQELVAELRKLEQDTGLTPAAVVGAMQSLIQTGRVPESLAKYPQYEAKVKAITRLMLNVEPGRGLPATVTLPINFELMKKGLITPEEAFVSLNTMSPQGITKIAHEADQALGFTREGKYKEPAKPEQVEPLLQKEKEWLVRYLLSCTQGENPLIKNEQDLKQVLDNLPDLLKDEAKKFFIPEE
ncbi:MAG TPA: hypothetical protein DDW51_28280, partial [Cyanobacteria bacterium UBA11367]|nr:hypothetical protein [Cyanobacteria bacterium UBA11367]